MTSSELRRLADHKVSESYSLVRDADRLRSQAAGLHGLLNPLITMSQRVWVGPAATDFEVECAWHARQVDEQAVRIARIAGELEEQADELRRQAEVLRAEARASDAATAEAVGLPAGVY